MRNIVILLTSFFLISFCQSCVVFNNTIPAVASNDTEYFQVQNKISSSPRYLNGDDLYFIYREHYNDQDSFLEYKILDQKRNVVQSSLTNPVSVQYGLNKIKLPMRPSITTGIYVLEIINEKDQKKYITFLKSV